ncbi:hypothetical protein ACIGQE_21520 [Streptomyces sp. NPDC053429]|uniref:hypothetical protein n=1 Tax=Streptomyces sp. NPDC053429 TaxID=3365702 RepID=UPI0037D8E6DB
MSPFGDLKDILGTVTAKSVGVAHVNGEAQVAVTTGDGKGRHTIRHADRTWAGTTQVRCWACPRLPAPSPSAPP